MVRGCKTWWACKIEKSAAVFISVIVYPLTLQFVAISLFLKNARAYCIFDIYLAKPLSDYNPQEILFHCRMVNKTGQKLRYRKLKVIWKVYWLRCQSVVYHFKPLLRETKLTLLTTLVLFSKYNAPGISEMRRSTFHRSTSCIFFQNGDKQKSIQRCE